uniref:Uncharacterized protein n=1 Tax=Anopheles coluzzii TaxID=1518534 RepID=A0A8W7PD64_ANOCL
MDAPFESGGVAGDRNPLSASLWFDSGRSRFRKRLNNGVESSEPFRGCDNLFFTSISNDSGSIVNEVGRRLTVPVLISAAPGHDDDDDDDNDSRGTPPVQSPADGGAFALALSFAIIWPK